MERIEGQDKGTGEAMVTNGGNGRIGDAYRLAEVVHAPQQRKGTEIPYIAHPLDVARIVHRYGGTEDEIIGALLHDVLEDGEPPPVAQVAAFGPAVLGIVKGLSDFDGSTEKRDAEGQKPAWEERKSAYLARLGSEPASAQLVCGADKLANLRDMLDDLDTIGAALWERFKVSPDRIVWYHREVARILGGSSDERVRKLAAAVGRATEELAARI